MPFPGGFGGGAGGASLGTTYADVELRLTKLEEGFRKANAGFEKFGKDANAKLKRVGEGIETIGKKLSVSLTAPIVGLGVASVRSATQLDSLRRGLTAITGSSRETERQLSRLKEVAKLPGLSFKGAIEGSINLQSAGFAAQQAERTIKAFGNALATAGKGSEDLKAVIYNLVQISSAGKITGDEIRETASRIPMFGRLMREEFGTMSGEALKKMGVSADEFITRMTERLEKLPSVTGGVQNAFENFGMAADEALSKIGETLLPTVSRLLEDATEKLDTFSKWWGTLSESAQESILGSLGVVATVGAITLALGKVITTIAAVKVAFAQLNAPAWFLALFRLPVAATATAGFLGGKALTEMAQGKTGQIYKYDPSRGIVPTSPGAASMFYFNTPQYRGPAEPAAREDFADRMQLAKDIRDAAEARRKKGLKATTPASLDDLTESRLNIIEMTQGTFARKREEAGIRLRKLGGEKNKVALREYFLTLKKIGEEETKANKASLKETRERLGQRQEALEDIARAGQEQMDRDIEDLIRSMQEASNAAEAEQKKVLRLYRDIRNLQPELAAIIEGAGMGLAAMQRRALERRFPGLATPLKRPSMEFTPAAMATFRKDAMRMQAEQRQRQAERMFGGLGSTLEGLTGISTDALQRDAKKIRKSMERNFNWMGELATNLADSFYQSFSEGLDKMFGRNPLGRALARTISQWFDQMMSQALATLTNPNTTGEQKGKAGKGLLGGILGSAFGPIGGVLGGLFGGLFAEGGRAPGRRWSVVGERGPELVYPSADMQVVPLSRMGAAGPGGVTVNMGGVVIRETADADRVMDRIASRLQTMQRVRG